MPEWAVQAVNKSGTAEDKALLLLSSLADFMREAKAFSLPPEKDKEVFFI